MRTVKWRLRRCRNCFIPIHQCQAFLLNDTVVAFRWCKNPTGVRNDVAILFQDNSKTYSTCICLQLERTSGRKNSGYLRTGAWVSLVFIVSKAD